jgi:hypothetical protein
LPVVAIVPFVETNAHQSFVRRRRRLMQATAVVATIAGVYGIWVLKLWKFVV